MLRVTPLDALLRGCAAGIVGAAVQSAFFNVSSRLQPSQPEGVFEPPEPQQAEEPPTGTVARRTVEGLMARGPLTPRQKALGGTLVHYGYGALWGGVYGLMRESTRNPARPPSVLGYSALVWAAGDLVVLPAFKIYGWPHRYPLRNHAYAFVAHVVYGAAVAATYEAARPRAWGLAAAIGHAAATRARWRADRRIPAPLRPAAGRLAGAAAALRAAPRQPRLAVAALRR